MHSHSLILSKVFKALVRHPIKLFLDEFTLLILPHMAQKKRSKEEWLAKAVNLHQGKYDYSLWGNEVQATTRVTNICPEHGQFSQTLVAHARGQGCAKCAAVEKSLKQTLSKEGFLLQAKTKYPTNDYSQIVYQGYLTPIMVDCREHGPFQMIPKRHLRGKNCSSCEEQETGVYTNRELFSSQASLIHKDEYSYSLVKLRGKHPKVKIICELHSTFEVSPYQHLRGEGCPSCIVLAGGRIRGDSQAAFIFKASEIHNNKYDYSKIVYKGSKIPIEIICPQHSNFWQTPNDHITTQGCKQCGISKRADHLKLDIEEFIKRAAPLHGNKFDYSKVVYKNNSTKVTIICPIHGKFQQTPLAHFKGNGCAPCQKSAVSFQQVAIYDFIRSHYTGTIILNDRTILHGGKELDIWLPEVKVAIEFNGLHWHTLAKVGRDYHAQKTAECRKLGIRLLHVWEDDWQEREDIVKRHVLSILNLSVERKVYARKCEVREVTTAEAAHFLKENHIQGYSPSTVKLGLFENGTNLLVACATFRKDSAKSGSYVLTRYATNCQVVGGHSKLLKHFQSHWQFDELVTFADLAFSYGDLYLKTGWHEERSLYPDYCYVVGKERHHKFGYRLKRFRDDSDLLWQEGLTEWQLAELNGLERLYDAGKLRFTWSKTIR
jgi:hypothetical protein